MKRSHSITPTLAVAITLYASIERTQASAIESMGKALATLLGTTKVFKKSITVDGKDTTIYYSKGSDGKAAKVAFIQNGVYEPNCGHTLVVGINATDGKISEVRITELGCPHALPIKAASFLDQYKGKGLADLATLDSQVTTIAKATGSCKIATDAVKRSITIFSAAKGQL